MGTAASPPWLLESPSGMFVFKRTGKQCTGLGSILAVCLPERTESANVTQPVGPACPGGIPEPIPPSRRTLAYPPGGLPILHGSASAARPRPRFLRFHAAPRFRPRPFGPCTTAGWQPGAPDTAPEPLSTRGGWHASTPSYFTGRRGGRRIKIWQQRDNVLSKA